MNNLNILKQLSEAFGPSGFEEEINTIICSKLYIMETQNQIFSMGGTFNSKSGKMYINNQILNLSPQVQFDFF